MNRLRVSAYLLVITASSSCSGPTNQEPTRDVAEPHEVDSLHWLHDAIPKGGQTTTSSDSDDGKPTNSAPADYLTDEQLVHLCLVKNPQILANFSRIVYEDRSDITTPIDFQKLCFHIQNKFDMNMQLLHSDTVFHHCCLTKSKISRFSRKIRGLLYAANLRVDIKNKTLQFNNVYAQMVEDNWLQLKENEIIADEIVPTDSLIREIMNWKLPS